jgi:anti-sigma B factor antagonist
VDTGVVDRRVVDGLTVLTLAGELDVSVAAALRRDLTRSATATRPDVAVDLRQVTFLDASTIGVLVGLYKEIRAAGGCLRLIGAEQGPLRLVRLCKLDGVLCVHGDVETATAAVCDRHQAQSVS